MSLNGILGNVFHQGTPTDSIRGGNDDGMIWNNDLDFTSDIPDEPVITGPKLGHSLSHSIRDDIKIKDNNQEIKCDGTIGINIQVTNQADADAVKQYIAEAMAVLESYGIDPSTIDFMPSTIIIGDTGAGSYSDGDTWFLEKADDATIYSKVIQSYLNTAYPGLGYVGIEAFSMAMNPADTPRDTAYYDPANEGLDGGDIAQAYADCEAGIISERRRDEIINQVANNPIALSQVLNELEGSGISNWNDVLVRALSIVNENNSDGIMTAPELADALFAADAEINGGANTSTIITALSNHGIGVGDGNILIG